MTSSEAETDLTRVAFIDDDLATSVSFNDLRHADTPDSLLERLDDETDPLYQQVVTALGEIDFQFNGANELAEIINNPDLYDALPDEIKEFSERIREKKESSAAPLLKIEEWVNECFTNVTIAKYSSPQEFFDAGELYDILLIDYLLVEDDESQTIAFIKTLKENEQSETDKQLFVLMSSHGDKLREDFAKLKTELKMTSSRFRILEKPSSEEPKYEWSNTLEALPNERELISDLESFILQWGERIIQSAKQMADELWCLDAYALSMLRQAASEDEVDFYEYFSEIIMRKALAEIESANPPHEITFRLGQKIDSSGVIAPGTEINDSRAAIRKWINEICWHKDWLPYRSDIQLKDSFQDSDFGQENMEEEQKKFTWIVSQLSFGSVLRKESGQLFVHLTQPCDSARLKYMDRGSEHLFFLPGTEHPLNSAVSGRYGESLSPSLYIDDRWANVHWNLSNPISYSIQSLIDSIDDYKLVARLRNDLAQKVLVEYASKITRVASIRTPCFLNVIGYIAECKSGSQTWAFASDIEIKAHIRQEKNKWVLEASPGEAIKYLIGYSEMNFDEMSIVKSICKGIHLNFDQQKPIVLNTQAYSLVLGTEIFVDKGNLDAGLERLKDKLKSDPATDQLMAVFARA